MYVYIYIYIIIRISGPFLPSLFQICDVGKCIFIEEFLQIDAAETLGLENSHFAAPDEIMDPGLRYSGWGDFTPRAQLAAPGDVFDRDGGGTTGICGGGGTDGRQGNSKDVSVVG